MGRDCRFPGSFWVVLALTAMPTILYGWLEPTLGFSAGTAKTQAVASEESAPHLKCEGDH